MAFGQVDWVPCQMIWRQEYLISASLILRRFCILRATHSPQPLQSPYLPLDPASRFRKDFATMRQCMDEENLHRRLKKIVGQVQAIDRMIDEDIPCEDILTQVNAAKSALHKVGQIILEGHLQHCVRDGIEHGNADETIAKFAKAVERFSNIV
jgi:DNA-binding FrmR family transcriptional regulator